MDGIESYESEMKPAGCDELASRERSEPHLRVLFHVSIKNQTATFEAMTSIGSRPTSRTHIDIITGIIVLDSSGIIIPRILNRR
uniref:Uncharacterized protein n=1 Tax=Candidatus Kentrum sp. TC TaxID=2126339 RepID=A0A450Z9D8_9GAMM|nr:MAG: hypothetical protein BECKTC1821E_GA0114239_104317 [Candidatus Kentron sp. TC]VFK50389.1 MAG: hypothetical protein BECKTC1821D_GA0114238_11017 [Candidatus Kentron sp. TC]